MGTKKKDGSTMRLISRASFLDFLVEGEPFVIPALMFDVTPFSSEESFSEDEEFPTRVIDEENPPTEITHVLFYEVERPATFKEALLSISPDIESLSFTERQVVKFLNTHIELLRCAKRSTFFLIKKNGKMFIALHMFWGTQARLRKFNLDYHYKLLPSEHYRLVVPDREQ